MSDIRQKLEENSAQLFDRLVDNELSPAEQRELLAALEDEPGGWRRCALAFIEANAWRDTLIGVRAEQTVSLSSSVLCGRRRKARWFHGLARWSYGFALAASVLVAFACGRYVASGPVERELAAMRGRSTDNPVVSTAVDNRVSNDDFPSIRPGADSSGQAAPGWQTVQLNIADALAGEPEAVEVPCLDASHADLSQINQAWLAKQDSAVSAQMLQALEETGHAVTTEMQLWPIEMTDGRRIVLPVEQVEVRYVGGELY
jgi:hypothetical protein